MCVRVGIGDPIWRESAPPSCEGWPEYKFQFSVRVGLNAVVATCGKPSQAGLQRFGLAPFEICFQDNPLMDSLIQNNPSAEIRALWAPRAGYPEGGFPPLGPFSYCKVLP